MKLKKWFTLIWIIIYIWILSVIIIPSLIFILNSIEFAKWSLYFWRTLQYLNNFVDNRTSQIIFVKNKNTSFWKVFFANPIFWKNYWDDITENNIKTFIFYKQIENKYKLFRDTNNIHINYLNISNTFIWESNLYNIKNILLSWKYKNHWFICKWGISYNINWIIQNYVYTCQYNLQIQLLKKIKDNVYLFMFIYNNKYNKTFYVITNTTNKDNNF